MEVMDENICGVYIVTNDGNRIIYIGMSTMLLDRIQSHREKLVDGFAKKHNCTRLVYYEILPDKDSALYREKELKGWSRLKKTALIQSLNPTWKDLFDELLSLA